MVCELYASLDGEDAAASSARTSTAPAQPHISAVNRILLAFDQVHVVYGSLSFQSSRDSRSTPLRTLKSNRMSGKPASCALQACSCCHTMQKHTWHKLQPSQAS